MPGNRKAWGDGKMSRFKVQDSVVQESWQGTIANCKLQIANCKLRQLAVGSGQCETASGFQRNSSFTFIIHHSSFILHPSSFIPRPSRAGLSLMEVLLSIFVLSIGLLGVAAIIPLGQISLWETAKADRSGACGRAAMREIQVRRMLDFRYWYWLPRINGELTPSEHANRGCF